MEEERAGRDEGAEVVRAEAGLPLTGRQCTEGFLPGDATLGEVGRFRRPNAARSRFCEAPKAGGVAEAERRAGAAGGRGLSRSRSSAAGQVLRWAARFRRARGALTSGVPPLPSHTHTHTHTHARTHARDRRTPGGAFGFLLQHLCWSPAAGPRCAGFCSATKRGGPACASALGGVGASPAWTVVTPVCMTRLRKSRMLKACSSLDISQTPIKLFLKK